MHDFKPQKQKFHVIGHIIVNDLTLSAKHRWHFYELLVFLISSFSKINILKLKGNAKRKITHWFAEDIECVQASEVVAQVYHLQLLYIHMIQIAFFIFKLRKTKQKCLFHAQKLCVTILKNRLFTMIIIFNYRTIIFQ